MIDYGYKALRQYKITISIPLQEEAVGSCLLEALGEMVRLVPNLADIEPKKRLRIKHPESDLDVVTTVCVVIA